MPPVASARAYSKATMRAPCARSCASKACCPSRSRKSPSQETARAGVGKGWLSFKFQRGLSPRTFRWSRAQLATLVKSALPLEEALLAVSQQTDKPRVRNIMLGVRSKVMEGHALADSLGEFPTSFPEIYRATIAASEHSGHLDTVMERLADYTENREELRSRTLGAMLYPVLVFTVCVAIVFFLLVSVVPKIVEVFRNSEAELPILTQALIAGSDFMRHYGLILFAAIALAIWLFRRSLRIEANRRRWHEFLLRLPLIGKVVRGSNTARFARTLSTLTGEYGAGARCAQDFG
jgi:general secretion pathway protein F